MSGLEIFITFAIVAIFIALVAVLVVLKKKTKISFSIRVFIALGLGLLLGISLLFIFPDTRGKLVIEKSSEWINILGGGFINLLQLVIVPLVLLSIIKAITQLSSSKDGAKKSGFIIGFLLITTAISAVISIFTVKVFNLSADKLIAYSPSDKEAISIPATLLSMIPKNVFSALASNSVLPIIIIALLLSIAYIGIKRKKPDVASKFNSAVNTSYEFVMRIVKLVISLTPYGVLAIITVRISTGNWQLIVQLGLFILASFTAMAVVFILHLLISWALGVKPTTYLKKTSPALIFAFVSRSSAATLPLTVSAQRNLGVPEDNANLSSTLGTCIGQNACAGVYPTMLAILVGLVQGINVWTPAFIIPLIIYVVIASIGTAGVGGGATNVSLVVLSLMGLPIELVAILISVDFIIDMGRTLVNVNDSILAGIFVSRIEKNINKDILHNKITVEEFDEQKTKNSFVAENI